MNQHIETLLTEQSHQLDKERQRLAEDLNGLHFSNAGNGDNGHNQQTNGDGESPEPYLDADKQHKEQLNQAISDQRSESNYAEPPRTGRRLVRPQVRNVYHIDLL